MLRETQAAFEMGHCIIEDGKPLLHTIDHPGSVEWHRIERILKRIDRALGAYKT